MNGQGIVRDVAELACPSNGFRIFVSWIVTLMINLVRPLSRGSVRLRSSNPDDDPEVDPNWFSHPEDTRRLLKAFKYGRKIFATEPLAPVMDEELAPGAATVSDDDLIEYMKQSTESNYHPVGTCRMGKVDDPSTVVGPDLRVKGVEGLRVMDASMMPTIISANTNATAMAVADKGKPAEKAVTSRRTERSAVI